jgi:glycerophosphoryl diester phosphodiesterase
MIAQPFRIIAHRGASAYAPENTMAAFRKAVDMGVVEVETDVGFTKDRALLLFHDDTLERTTNGTGVPSDYTLDELKQLDAGSWLDPAEYPDFRWDSNYTGEHLITLDELFEVFGDTLTYHVELKDRTDGLVAAVIESIRRHNVVDRVFLTIIDDEAYLLEAKRLEPRIRTALAPVRALGEKGAEVVDEVARGGHEMLILASFNQTKELVDRAHALGMEARSSGIRSRQQMIEAVQIGCNGMTINWPDWLIGYVTGKGASLG